MWIDIIREQRRPNAEHVFGKLLIAARAATPAYAARRALSLDTMEPPTREDGLFIPGESALPPNTYDLSLDYCRRQKHEVPLLTATPQHLERRASHFRLGMWIHNGGRGALDSCCDIVIGRTRLPAEPPRLVAETAEAFAELMAEIRFAKRIGEAIEVRIT